MKISDNTTQLISLLEKVNSLPSVSGGGISTCNVSLLNVGDRSSCMELHYTGIVDGVVTNVTLPAESAWPNDIVCVKNTTICLTNTYGLLEDESYSTGGGVSVIAHVSYATTEDGRGMKLVLAADDGYIDVFNYELASG